MGEDWKYDVLGIGLLPASRNVGEILARCKVEK